MNPLYLTNEVEYYLVKRKPKKGKAIYHARFLDKKLDSQGRRIVKKSMSTKQTNEALAHKVVAKWIEDGKIDAVPTNLKKFLLDFWDSDKSDYLKNKFRQGKTYSTAYIDANVSVIKRLFLLCIEKKMKTADEKKIFVKEKFSSISHKYDFLNSLLSFKIDSYWRWVTTRELKIFPDGAVLDLCAGTLPLSLELTRQAPKRQVVAIDFCEDMLRAGLKTLPRDERRQRIFPVCGDGEKIPATD